MIHHSNARGGAQSALNRMSVPLQSESEAPLDIRICASRESLRTALRTQGRIVYSCLNGYTLRALLLERSYDDLLASGKVAFIVDGLLAVRHLRRLGIRAERICGRDLLDEALRVHSGSVTLIGGGARDGSRLLSLIRQYTGRHVDLVTPPMFQSTTQVHEFARALGPRISPDSLVVVCIRSPLQDILSGALSTWWPQSVFINVGAVLDDIAGGRMGSIRFFSRFGLEWLYRLVVSPSRTWPKIAAMVRKRLGRSYTNYRWHQL